MGITSKEIDLICLAYVLLFAEQFQNQIEEARALLENLSSVEDEELMPLKMEIEYDHASGLFEAHLENGARFKFRREDINGKLENCLTLYRNAVVRFIEDKTVQRTSKSQERKELMELSAGRSVEVIKARKERASRRPLNLDDLEIDF